MKIIYRDNYDRDNVSDILIAENVNTLYGKAIVDFLNSKSSSFSPFYFALVEDDYKLYKFESNLK